MKLDLPLSTGGDDAASAARALADAGVDGAYSFEGPADVFVPLAPTGLSHRRKAGVNDLRFVGRAAGALLLRSGLLRQGRRRRAAIRPL